MSDIVYNGTNVDTGIELIRGNIDTYDTILSNIESAAKTLSSTKGFDLLGSCAGVANGSLTASVEDSKIKFEKLIYSIRAIQMTLMKYDEGQKYLSSFLNSLSDSEWQALTGGTKLSREEFQK